ncbi:MAG: hypothetical protein IPM91_06090 [Bacteroidetes bacterium]|nr:hypothetical protein [Bacteroidota bacterium]
MKTPVTNTFNVKLFLIGIFMITTLQSISQTNERIRVIFGTRSRPSADGKGCEGDKGTCFIFNTKDKVMSDVGVAEVSEVNGRINFNIVQDPSPAGPEENVFYVHEDKVLPTETARELGYESVIIKRGEYPLDKRKNRLGTVQLIAIFK